MLQSTVRDGVHQFKFPFIGHGEGFGVCDVKANVGENIGVNENTNYQYTFVITQENASTPALEHFVENICSDIKRWFESINGFVMPVDKIRWIQVLPYDKNGARKDVKMIWDKVKGCFHSPTWTIVA